MANRSILMGRLVKDPTIRTAGETVIANFTVACDRDFKKDGEPSADFISCVAFGKSAQFIEKWFHKGDGIYLEGHIQTGSYTNKDGQKVFTTDVVCDKVSFTVGSKGNSNNAENGNSTDVEGAKYTEVTTNIDEELPFR